jgi:ATP-dependent exoDNAse (exonuclease V) alpha subunit
MVAALANAPGLAVVVGPAGAGKTAALAAATPTWRSEGRPVTGAALAAVTARRLEHATGIPSMSLARVLADANAAHPDTGRPAGLSRGGVLVVDEASMVDTRTLAALLTHTKAADATLVLVGDPAQLPEIGAGGLFAALARHPTRSLADNRRQVESWERRALADLRAGDSEAAIAAYAARQRLHTAPSGELPERVVADYLRLRDQADQPDQIVMLAVRRADVALLNQAVREQLLAAGQLGEPAVVVGADRQREYRPGDLVIVTANDHRRGLLNGTRATLTHVDGQQRTLTLATDDHRRITMPAGWAADRLDHGYALTCHKAQGATLDTALLYGAGTLAREAGYVGLSRGRRANHLYVPDDIAPDEPEDSRLVKLAAGLATSRAQTMATRQLSRAPAMGRLPYSSPEHHGVHIGSEGITR